MYPLPTPRRLSASLQKTLVNLVHHMGGTIRKDFSTKVTHLIAYSTHGEKYKVGTVAWSKMLSGRVYSKHYSVHVLMLACDCKCDYVLTSPALIYLC